MVDLEEKFLDACKKIEGEIRTGVPPEEGICSTEEGEISFNPETKSAEIETEKSFGEIYEVENIYPEDNKIVVEGENSKLSLESTEWEVQLKE